MVSSCIIDPTPDQQDGETATRGQSTSAAVTALDLPDERKLFEAFDQIDSLESYDVRETYRKAMTQLSFLLNKITEGELRPIRISLKSARWQLGTSLDDIPVTKEKLEMYISLRTTPLDVRMIEYLEEAIEEEKTKKKLVEALKKHRDELKSFSEKSLEYLKEQGVKCVTNLNPAKPEENLLKELLKLKKYLQNNLKVDKVLFLPFHLPT